MHFDLYDLLLISDRTSAPYANLWLLSPIKSILPQSMNLSEAAVGLKVAQRNKKHKGLGLLIVLGTCEETKYDPSSPVE